MVTKQITQNGVTYKVGRITKGGVTMVRGSAIWSDGDKHYALTVETVGGKENFVLKYEGYKQGHAVQWADCHMGL